MKTKNNFQNFEDFTMIPTKESDPTNDFIQITKQTKTLNDLDWDSMLLTPENIKNMKPQVQNQKDFLKNKQPSLQEFILEYSHGQNSSSNDKSAKVADVPSSVDSTSTSNSTSTEKKTVNLLELLAKKDNSSSPPSNSKGAMSSEPINPQPSTSRYASPFKSPVKSERWAGAAFSNSPAPSSLPIPVFALDESSSSSSSSSSLERNDSPYKQPTRSNFSPLKNQIDQPFSSAKSLQQELPTKQPKPILKKSRPTSPPTATSSTPSTLSASAKQKQYVPKAQSQLVQSQTGTTITPANSNHMSSKAQVNAQEQVPVITSSLPKALLVAAQHHQHHQYQYPNQPQQQHQALQGGVVLPFSSPAQDLDQLSNQLKMMLNICPVRS